MSTSHWHVLGAGSIGCLFASKLQLAGYPTTLLLRRGCAAKSTNVTLQKDGISTNIELQVSAATDSGHIDCLLVTTKAQDVCAAAQSVRHRLNGTSQVLLLSNGLGFADELRAALSGPTYFFGTTTEGAYRLGKRHICHAGVGVTRIGQQNCAVPPPWFGDWAEAVKPSVWDSDIEQALWLKLAINCAINPLTALHRCRNGKLAEEPLAPLVKALCTEIMAVSAAAGFAAATQNLPDKVAEVIRATADNRSSMLQDILAGRCTEIKYITGHLLHVAQEHGVAAQQNAALYRSIVTLGT